MQRQQWELSLGELVYRRIAKLRERVATTEFTGRKAVHEDVDARAADIAESRRWPA
jgi:hypothetical protein